MAENSTTVVYFTSLGMSMKAAVTFITVGGSTRNGSELSFSLVGLLLTLKAVLDSIAMNKTAPKA